VGQLQVKAEAFEAEIAKLKRDVSTSEEANRDLMQVALLSDSVIADLEKVVGVSQRVVEALMEGQAVLRSRLPAQRSGVVPKQGEITRLHKAAESGDVAAILKFADRPEFINAQTAGGQTPMWCAACYGKTEAVKALASLGANVNTPASDGATPVCAAAQNRHELTVRLLASLGADMNTPSNDGIRPVFIASEMGHESTVRALVSLGADVTAVDAEGSTPLHAAAGHPSAAICALLLADGADANARDKKGRTAADIALAVRDQGVVSFVRPTAAPKVVEVVGRACLTCQKPTHLTMGIKCRCDGCKAVCGDLHFRCWDCQFDFCGKCAPPP
jgi:ankyrin repeat protein